MIVFVVPSASDEDAVTPTVAAFAAFSATVLVPPLESDGAEASNSSTSVRVIVTVSTSEAPLLSEARRVRVQELVSS